jgi:hypothetical protein
MLGGHEFPGQKEAEELGKKAKEGLDGFVDKVKDKGKEAADEAKKAITPETIAQIKAILKKIREHSDNILLGPQVPDWVPKVIEKLEKLLGELDPPSPDLADLHVRALREFVDLHLEFFIDAVAAVAKQDLDAYLHRLLMVYDLFTAAQLEIRSLPKPKLSS